MNSSYSSGPDNDLERNADEDRVNYWLNYLADATEDNSESEAAVAVEKSRSEAMPSNPDQNLGALGEMLLGNAGGNPGVGDEFDLLQEILVKPEMIEFRERIGQLEHKCATLESRNDAEEFARIFLPLMSKLLNRKLAKLKQEIVSELTPLLERLIEEQYDREKHLSIRVVGIQKDAN